MKKKQNEMERFDQMDPEERKYEARRRITRMVIIRLFLAALLVWVIFSFNLTLPVIAVLIAVIGLILGTLVPVFTALKTTLKYEDE